VKLAICTVSPPRYPHSAVFREVAETLHAAATALGHQALLTNDSSLPGYHTIVLGTNLLLNHPQPVAKDAILYNLEQVQRGPWFNERVLSLYRQYELWDFSEANANELERFGLTRPHVVPIGWAPILQRIKPKPEDIDVLFYGCINGRRKHVLESLCQHGVRVESLFGVYGKERDEYIARAKIVLNMHFYEARVFEIVRTSYLLANGRLVLSERGASPEDEAPFETGVAFASYDQLVPRCLALLKNADERQQIAANGQRLMEARPETSYLQPALEKRAGHEASANPSRPAVLSVGVSFDRPLPAHYGWSRPDVVTWTAVQGAALLDVGCAAGSMGQAMLAKGAREVVGVDKDPEAIGLARTRLTAAYRYDLNEAPELPYPDGYFDILTFANVLEELVSPETSLHHLLRWLRPGGTVVCCIPNVRHESVLLPLLFEGAWNYADGEMPERTQLRFFTLSSIQQFIASAGLTMHSDVQAVPSHPSPRLQQVAELLRALGGNSSQFLLESRAPEYIVAASAPTLPSFVQTRPILDPWRGSRLHRLLLAPNWDDPNDCWERTLRWLAAPDALEDTVTVGIATPVDILKAPPAALVEVADQRTLDLLFIEVPSDQMSWRRLLGGTHTWLATSTKSSLHEEAARIGVEVLEASSLLA
jgi:2-polyprenyl-3-methyl-5-hydroxy-6-metoxy-1,4-benzoquinol methylase